MYDIDTIDTFYAGILYHLQIVPDTMPPFTINNIDSPEDVFVKLWPLRQFPVAIKRMTIIAEQGDTGLKTEIPVKLYRWRWLTKWLAITRSRALRFRLLKEADKTGLIS